MNLNEHHYYINEKDMRFEALQQLREVQAELTRLNFLEVISMMRPENPLKKEVLKFEEDLNDLTSRIGKFIQDAKNDVEYEPSPEEIAVAGDEDQKIDDEENPIDNEKQKEMKAKGKEDKSVKESLIFDSSISKV